MNHGNRVEMKCLFLLCARREINLSKDGVVVSHLDIMASALIAGRWGGDQRRRRKSGWHRSIVPELIFDFLLRRAQAAVAVNMTEPRCGGQRRMAANHGEDKLSNVPAPQAWLARMPSLHRQSRKLAPSALLR